MRIYGPYIRKDGRKHIIIVHDDGSKQTKSYPRYLLEQHLGRELTDQETVDHINEDFTDDRIENLQILTRIENARKAAKPEKTFTFNCPECGSETTKRLRDVKHNRKQGKPGPFCSKSCAGKRNKRLNPHAGLGVRKGTGRRKGVNHVKNEMGNRKEKRS